MNLWPFQRESADEKRHKEIINKLEKIMSKISDYADRVNAKFDEITTGISGLTTSIAGIADDVLWLKEKIEELQNNPGEISPADQVLLDAIEARIGTTATNLAAAKTSAEQLDATTQRPEPPTP